MGCQGEIYNIYGVIVDSKIEKHHQANSVVYSVNGHTVCSDRNEISEFYGGIPSIDKKELCIRILGHSSWMGSLHFNGKALVGYVVANESYIDGSTVLPAMESIEALRPKLLKDIHKKLGLTVNKEDVKLHLLFDSINGM